jgi:hypothetical protein
VAVGDFNADGFTDIAVLNRGDSTISILLGNGSGGFTVSATKPASGANAIAIAAADLDGDGSIDLVVTNSTSKLISTLRGNGDGTFKTATTSTTPSGGSPYGLALGDFNGDGILDLATLNNANQVNIFLGDGAGGFAISSGSPFAVGSGAASVAVGDLNGDGFLDFVTANPSASTVTVMRGDGTGNAFVLSTVTFANGSAPTGIVADDFNGDGKLDLAVTEANSSKVAVLLGNGDTTFGGATTYTTGSTPASVITGDFNADGIRDLVVANQNGNNLTILFGTGTGTFQLPAQTVSTGGNSPSALAVADFNGDGNGDVAVTNSASGTLGVLLNELTDTSTVSFTAISIPGSGNHAVAAAYSGDSSFSASTSNTVSLAATPIPTTTLLSSSQSSPSYGQQIVLTATVHPNPVGTLTPTNGDTVTFKDGATTIGSSTLTNGIATLNVTSLAVGAHNLTAVFGGDSNFVTSTSSAVPLTVTQTTPVLTWNTPAPITYPTVLSSVQLNASTTVPGTFVYTPAVGTIPTAGTKTLSVTFTPSDTTDYSTVTQTVQLIVNKGTPTIYWTLPSSITTGTALSSIQLDATAGVGTIAIPLNSYYNRVSIYTAGTTFTSTGGYDDDGNAYDSATLGTSLQWQNINFLLGPANQPDSVNGGTVALPNINSGTLYLIGGGSFGGKTNQSVVITYTDGTTTSAALSISDWWVPSYYSDESIVKSMTTLDYYNGTQRTGTYAIYGYQIALDPSRTVQSVSLPTNTDIVFLAMALSTYATPGTFTYNPAAGTVLPVGTQTLSTTFTPTDTTNLTTATATVPLTVTPYQPVINWPTPAPISYGTPLSSTQLNATASVSSIYSNVALSSFYNASSIYTAGTTFTTGGFDTTGYAYDSVLLGTSIQWQNITFPFGPPNVPNSVANTSVVLPKISANALYLIGGSSHGGKPNQTFVVNYTDGSNTTVQIGMSDWWNPSNYTGETILQKMTTLDSSNGTQIAQTIYLYGYQIALDPTRTVQSIILPSNTEDVFLAMALSSPVTSFTVPGTFAYTPPAGTILPVGTDNLAVAFTPTDTTNYSNASAINQIVVNKATPTISLSSSANPAPLAIAVTFTATLSNSATGTVKFLDGTTVLGTSNVSSGIATYTTSSLTIGTHSITAVYSGDTNDLSVTSSVLSQVISKSTATVTISGVPNPSAYIQSVTMTIKVTGINTVVPTGTVTLMDGATPLGSPLTLDSTGKATYSTTTLAAGSHVITATYSGDTNYN